MLTKALTHTFFDGPKSSFGGHKVEWAFQMVRVFGCIVIIVEACVEPTLTEMVGSAKPAFRSGRLGRANDA